MAESLQPESSASISTGSETAGADAPAHDPLNDEIMFRGGRRSSVDYAMRTAQQNLVVLTGQADLKASIVITSSAVLISIILSTWMNIPEFQAGAGTAVVFLAIAMLLAVVAVFPKFTRPAVDGRLPKDASPFFAGHVVHLDQDVYTSEIYHVLADDERLYRALTLDLHGLSMALVDGKYRWLRLSYASFLSAFAIGAIVQVIAAL